MFKNIGKGQVHFENLRISETTDLCELKKIFSVEDKRTAVISLHGCGNLQPRILRLFVQLLPETSPVLLTLGCCYHKMTINENWIMSNTIRTTAKELANLPIGAFRLACQERMTKWTQLSVKEHEIHKKAFLNRAIVECIYERIGYKDYVDTRRVNRRLGSSYDEVLKNLLHRNKVGDSEVEEWSRIFYETIASYEPYFDYIEPYT
uniref:Methyltransferase domain-containing protein n=1 Tax=Acrobeloides nanus TaxID=290746 RepID=A0A914D4Y8_9BILA